MSQVWVREFLETEDSLPLVTAIRKIRDETTGYLMQMYKGSNRELAMTLTKLDEAEHWATRHAVNTGKTAIVDRAELLRAAQDV